jgi:geranylgeranyl reductase family protein
MGYRWKTDLGSLEHPPGFIARRTDFDHWLLEKATSEFADIRTGTSVDNIVREDDYISVRFTNNGAAHSLTSPVILGAEGDRSLVARTLSDVHKENEHYCAGVRAYYSGVSDLHEKGFIELHFLKELLPGYLWIFPMTDGNANVGVGMLSSVISKKRIHLRKLLHDILHDHPVISKRFTNAQLEGEVKGWGLPLGSKKRTISGDNFLLAGDAASLIDPFTGEGIGNAMISGTLAAKTASEAIRQGRFDAAFLKEYDKLVYRQLWEELKLSRTMQKLTNSPWLFNFVVKKASTNTLLQETITGMFEDMDLRSRLKKPGFYFQLLFK